MLQDNLKIGKEIYKNIFIIWKWDFPPIIF